MLNSSLTWYIAWGAIPAGLSILLFLFTKSKASITSRPSDEKDPAQEGEGTAGKTASVVSTLLGNPLKHMIINVSGAAALFLILMFLMNPIKMGFYTKQSDWKMKVTFRDEKGQPIPVTTLSSVDLVPQPANREVYDDHTMLVDLDGLLEENSGLKVNYDMRFIFEGFEPIVLRLKDSINSKKFCNKTLESRTIELIPKNLIRRVRQASIVATPDSTISVQAFSIDN